LNLFGATSTVLMDSVVEKYCIAAETQAQKVRGASMDVDIDASLPKFKKHGKLHALRRISPLGLIRYERPQAEGDRVVIKEVISRYVNGEVEAQKEQPEEVAVTPRNYKFKAKGMNQLGGREVYVFEVTPLKKREKLFKGEVWIDARTFLKVQESGYLVKNPDILIKRVNFTRTYEIRDDIAVPWQVQSMTKMRIFGMVELTVDFRNFSVDTLKSSTGTEGDNQ
jgi:hypothetical protein